MNFKLVSFLHISQLKSHGIMNLQALQTLFIGLIMAKITYALPSSFAGQLTADDRNRIWCYIAKGPASRSLMYGIWYWWLHWPQIVPSHYWSQSLSTPFTSTHSSLRKRQHGYQLPHIEYNLHKTVSSIAVSL